MVFIFYKWPILLLSCDWKVWVKEIVNNEKVFKAKNNSSAEVKIKKNGTYEICAKTESKASITLDIELGMEYYICCSLGMGAFVGRPELSLVDPSIGKIEYEKIKK